MVVTGARRCRSPRRRPATNCPCRRRGRRRRIPPSPRPAGRGRTARTGTCAYPTAGRVRPSQSRRSWSTPSIAPGIAVPSATPLALGAMPATAQCTKPPASSSVTRRASSTVPAGGAVQLSAGEMSSPSHVKRGSIAPPSTHGAVSVNGTRGPRRQRRRRPGPGRHAGERRRRRGRRHRRSLLLRRRLQLPPVVGVAARQGARRRRRARSPEPTGQTSRRRSVGDRVVGPMAGIPFTGCLND